jgi:tRNA A37 threonylcarbamoyladenosine synthetase subunit TsaC/SUA5/YrdC
MNPGGSWLEEARSESAVQKLMKVGSLERGKPLSSHAKSLEPRPEVET